MQNISASAISRILNSAGIKKALKRSNAYSTGFEVAGFDKFAKVYYTPRQIDDLDTELKRIMDTINGHKSKKYVATLEGNTVNVVLREVKEEKAEEVPDQTVTIEEVYKVIAPGRYGYTETEGGFLVSRVDVPDERLVRVAYRDHAHTTYAPETGGREAYAMTTVERYATDLMHAGYAAMIDYDDDKGWSVLVGRAGEFGQKSQADASEEAQEPLMDLRKAIEKADLSFMTRKAGPTSIFVYFLVPFKDKLRRLEVFWSEGLYASYGRFGGAARHEFYSLESLVSFIKSEIGE